MSAKAADDKQIFLQAVENHEPERWPGFLDDACGNDPALRARVEALLTAYRQPNRIFDYDGVRPAFHHPSITERAGTLIGPYKLVELIGEGGFGVVYRAEQTEPVRREVALKLIKPGMDTRQVIARFDAERQALAMMDHPNIAKVLDAGVATGDSPVVANTGEPQVPVGRPYFVMELVRGVPITEYCDECSLPTRERLELFIAVCQAVQHAHQKGIIHRDIKPTNVLVAMQDGQPAPKIIDFGVAKALEGRLTDRTVATGLVQMIGTPLYMSPEQAELSPLGVDTRSDVYSLGVLLYELLTGTTPFDKQRLHEAPYDEMRRIIREEEPPRPSTRISTLAADLATTAAEHRRTDARRMVQTVRGELDWIVMKCLDKDRNRRYESASSLARDVERYLSDEPVRACPPSAAYRFQKFARRHCASLVTVAAVLTIVIVGLLTSTFLIAQERDAAREAADRERQAADEARAQEARAERERQRAETNFRKAREAVDRLFTMAAEKMAGQPHMEHIRRALLEDALEFYQGFIQQKSDDPSVRYETAFAYCRVGHIYRLLGQLQSAEDPLRQSAALFESLSAEFPAVPEYRRGLGWAHLELARIFSESLLNRPEESLQHALARLDIFRKLSADFPTRPEFRREVAYALTAVGLTFTVGMKNVGEGEKYLREAVVEWESMRDNSPEDPGIAAGLAHAHHWFGSVLSDTSHLPEAETEYRRALAIYEELLAADPNSELVRGKVAHVKAYIANALWQTARQEEAVNVFRDAITIREKLRDDYPNTYEHYRRLGHLYREFGECLLAMEQTEEAEQVLLHRLQLVKETARRFPESMPSSPNLGWTYYNLGLSLNATGLDQGAADSFRLALADFEEHAANDFAANPDALHPLTWLLVTCPARQFRDPQRALELSKRSLQHRPRSAEGWRELGIAQYRTGDWNSAVESLETAIEYSGDYTALELFFLAMAHSQQGSADEARKCYDNACVQMAKREERDPEMLNFRVEAAKVLGLTEPKPSASMPRPEDKSPDIDSPNPRSSPKTDQ